MLAEAMVQQPNLHHRSILLHILIEVLQVGIAVDFLKNGLEIQGSRQIRSQSRFADSDGSRDADIAFRKHGLIPLANYPRLTSCSMPRKASRTSSALVAASMTSSSFTRPALKS